MDRPPKRIYEFGHFRLHPDARLLTRDGHAITLPPKAFDLLLMLVENSGAVVSKDELMQALWPDTFVQDQNLKQNIFLIRRALGEKPHGLYIASVHGKGYRFLPAVRLRGESLEAATVASVSNSKIVSISPAWKMGLSMIVFALLVILAAYLSVRRSPSRPPLFELSSTQNGNVPQRRSVAILSIQNLSGSRNDDWLSTAISEMLVTELGAGEQLRMISGEDIAKFKVGFGKNVAETLSRESLARARSTLGADLLISGACTIVGPRNNRVLRIDLRMQDAALGDTVAEISSAGKEDDLFALVSETGARLREKLAIRELTPMEFASVKALLPTNTQAVKLYSEALSRLREFEPLPARNLLEHVVAIEPTNSRAHSALSETWEMLGFQERSRDEARKAFELASALPEADRLWVEARWYETGKDWEKATKVYGKLFLSGSDNVDYGLHLARAEISAGKANEALRVVESLRRLPVPHREDPRIDLIEAAASQSLFDIPRAKAAAVSAAAKGTALDAPLIVAQAKYSLAEANFDLQNVKEAIADYEQSRDLYMTVGDKSGVCHAMIGIGNIIQGQDRPLAKAIFSRVLGLAGEIGNQRIVARALLDLGNVYYDDGDLKKAKARYEKAFAVYRDINDRPGMAGLLVNIGLTMDDLGEYHSAETNLRESLNIATASKLNFDVTDAYNILGTVLYHEGKLSESLQAYNNSLDVARAIQFKGGIVDNLARIGRIMRAQGQLGLARDKEKQALNIQDDSLTPRLELARIELEAHNPVAAEEGVRKVLPKANNQTADHLACYTILAQALLAQGKAGAADKLLKRAESLGVHKSVFLDTRLEFAVTSARIQAALGHTSHASTLLQRVITDARSFGNVPYQLEACDTLVTIEADRAAFLDEFSCRNTLRQHAANGFVLFAQNATRQ